MLIAWSLLTGVVEGERESSELSLTGETRGRQRFVSPFSPERRDGREQGEKR